MYAPHLYEPYLFGHLKSAIKEKGKKEERAGVETGREEKKSGIEKEGKMREITE